MFITPFALILIVYMAFVSFTNRSVKEIFKKMLMIFVSVKLNVRMGYFAEIGAGNYFTYNAFFSYIVGAVAVILIIRSNKKFNRFFICFGMTIIVLMINALFTFLFPFEEKIITNWQKYVAVLTGYIEYPVNEYVGNIANGGVGVGYYLTFVLFFLILYVAKTFLTRNDYIDIGNFVAKISKIHIIIGVVEFVSKTFFHSLIVTNITIFFFGDYVSQHKWLLKRAGFYELNGCTQEVSYFTTSLFYIAILLMILKKNNNTKSDNLWLVLIMLLLVCNPGLSTIIYVGLICLIWWILFARKEDRCRSRVLRRTSVVLLLGVLLVGIILNNYTDWMMSDNYILKRLGQAIRQFYIIISSKTGISYGSEAIRITGISEVVKLSAKRFWFGFGIGTITCDSGVITLFSNIGITGFTMWLIYVYRFYSFKNFSFEMIIFTIFVLIVPNLLLNDYDTITSIYIPIIGILYSITKNKSRRRVQDEKC